MLFNRRVLLASVCLSSMLFAETSFAGSGSWDGTWSGAWGGSASTSVTIKGKRVVSYTYQGQPVPITHSQVGAGVSFGSATYTVTIVKNDQNTASADYKGANGTSSALLTR